MRSLREMPVALTIAGSDSGGGAGIQADLKTFAAVGVHGTSAITCLTAQNPKAVIGIQACKTEMVSRQLEAVFAELRPAAAKTGMLLSTAIIRTVADFLKAQRFHPLVLDPVMVATSGAMLLKRDAITALRRQLLPLAMVVTPNLDEAQVLLRRQITSLTELQQAARELTDTFGVPFLVKGGHLRQLPRAIDILYDGRQLHEFSAPVVHGIQTHGTGCAYSAAIAAHLALGADLLEAVGRAKVFVTKTIRDSIRVGKFTALNL